MVNRFHLFGTGMVLIFDLAVVNSGYNFHRHNNQGRQSKRFGNFVSITLISSSSFIMICHSSGKRSNTSSSCLPLIRSFTAKQLQKIQIIQKLVISELLHEGQAVQWARDIVLNVYGIGSTSQYFHKYRIEPENLTSCSTRHAR